MACCVCIPRATFGLHPYSSGSSATDIPKKAILCIAGFDIREAGMRHERRQVLRARLHGRVPVYGGGDMLSQAGRALEVQYQQPPTRLQHAPDFGQCQNLEVIGQMVHHQAAQHNVKGPSREVERLHKANSKINLHALARRLPAGHVHHFRRGVDAKNLSGGACSFPGGDAQVAGAAAYV